jgi:hypothetical protein
MNFSRLLSGPPRTIVLGLIGRGLWFVLVMTLMLAAYLIPDRTVDTRRQRPAQHRHRAHRHLSA